MLLRTIIKVFGVGGSVQEKSAGIVRYRIKQLLGSMCRYEIEERPILILGTRRSGSTLLMRMIYSQPGVDYVDQPLDLWHYHPYKAQLPAPAFNRFISLSSGEERSSCALFLEDVLSGRKRLRHQWNLFDRDFSWVVHRLVLKELNLKDVEFIHWLAERCDVVFLIRHPVAVALSIMKLGWGNTAQAFLENDEYCLRYLDKRKIEFSQKVIEKGTDLEKFVLEWSLENIPLLQQRENSTWLTITYEELVVRPREISGVLCEKLKLPEMERMWKTVGMPTRTTTSDSKQIISQFGATARAAQWQAEISTEERTGVQSILDIMGIKEYSASRIFPANKLLHFRYAKQENLDA